MLQNKYLAQPYPAGLFAFGVRQAPGKLGGTAVTTVGIEEVFLRNNAGRHFVALAYRLRKDKEVHNLYTSGFLVELSGAWFLLTAGHWLEHEATGLKRQLAAGYRIDKIALADAFAGHTGSPLPFAFELDDWLAVYNDAEGFDFAALPIHPFHRRGLEAVGASPIELHATGPAEFHDDSQLALVGVPAESFDKKGADTQMKLVIMPLSPYTGDALPAKGDTVLAQLPVNPTDPAHRVANVVGMSGGPVFRIIKKADLQKKYWLVGIQSGWYEHSRVVRFCPIDSLVAALEELVEDSRRAAAG